MRTLPSYLAAFLVAALAAAPLHAQTTSDGDAGAADGYGNAVAVDGETVFVGEANNTYNPGAVYLYRREGSEWTRTGKLDAGDAGPNDGFGAALAARDGRLLASASSDDGGAYLFEDTGSGYEQIANLMPEGNVEGEGFGSGGVAMGGDWIAVGAPEADADGTGGAGAVYVFRNTGGNNWTQAARLTGSAADSSAAFGGAIDYRGGAARARRSGRRGVPLHAPGRYVDGGGHDEGPRRRLLGRLRSDRLRHVGEPARRARLHRGPLPG
ncbi:MAG: hypothetical protein BRD48_00635 [Bacteroidetes bacterium QS_9_68_14]|nr:MAG: hypothetical protein BRD48_00635 [Bacteroidetes bacterium QS_9_68_14]